MRTRWLLWSAPLVIWACTSCSSGPKPPAPGTPAFIWGAAKANYHSGDFRKANENLIQLVREQNEFSVRARPLAIVLSAGLAQGYIDLADAYGAGGRANRANPSPFRQQAMAYRSFAAAAALELAESAHLFLDKDTDPHVTLSCEYPTGSMAQPAALRKIASGVLMQDSEKELLETATLQREVLLSTSRALGTPEDAAKTLELFKGGEAKVGREIFVYGTAKALYDVSALYGPTKMDLPNRLKLMCQEALEALGSIPPTADTKALNAKIQAAVKNAKGAT